MIETALANPIQHPFPPLPRESLDAEQEALAAQLLKASEGHQGGPIPLLLRSPAMASRLRPLITYLTAQSPLPGRLRELAILIQAAFWRQDYEWWAHEPIALDSGIAHATLDALRTGRTSETMAEDEAAVHALCTELLVDRAVRPETLAAIRRHLDDRQIVDLIAVSGVYALLAMLLNLAGEGAPDDAPRPKPGIE